MWLSDDKLNSMLAQEVDEGWGKLIVPAIFFAIYALSYVVEKLKGKTSPKTTKREEKPRPMNQTGTRPQRQRPAATPPYARQQQTGSATRQPQRKSQQQPRPVQRPAQPRPAASRPPSSTAPPPPYARTAGQPQTPPKPQPAQRPPAAAKSSRQQHPNVGEATREYLERKKKAVAQTQKMHQQAEQQLASARTAKPKAAEETPQQQKSLSYLFTKKNAIVRGIIYHEILGPPVGMRSGDSQLPGFQ